MPSIVASCPASTPFASGIDPVSQVNADQSRVHSRPSTVSIRGLSDDFSTTLLNGREQVSVGHNRGVEFDQYPSELISGVVVYKTPSADLVGQAGRRHPSLRGPQGEGIRFGSFSGCC